MKWNSVSLFACLHSQMPVLALAVAADDMQTDVSLPCD
ncbi:MAG: hypothetical protein JWP16_1184 [Alphaproteobacteria bacterium]|nr:hypothetical protein [Alphaproteobacteria bacterium]MDB5740144.1 hypothetical protein [Alphaproteobacteria bacterium]